MEQNEIDNIKSNLRQYLENHNINTSKPFICINPQHHDTAPSMKYYNDNKVYCFGCCASYDLFDVISIFEGVNKKEAFKKAINHFDFKASNKLDKPKTKANIISSKDYSKAYYVWRNNYLKCNRGKDYLKKRGISEYIAAKFNIGFNTFHFNNTEFNAIVIPINKNCFTARNIEDNDQLRYYKTKQSHTEIFNSSALTNNNEYCFITEGEFDCLSLETLGYNSIALGGVNNVNKFITASKCPKKTYVLMLDNDEPGQNATKALIEYFKENKLNYITFIDLNFKDVNDALRNDKNNFKEQINKALRKYKQAEMA